MDSMHINFKNINKDKVFNDDSFQKFSIYTIHLFEKYNLECIFNVENDVVNENAPLFAPVENKIYINIKDFSIEQIIYQLSHEIMHQLIYSIAGVKTYNGLIKKQSEVLCCAFSWFILSRIGLYEYLQQRLNPIGFLYNEWWSEIFAMYKELDGNYEGCIYKYIDTAVQELLDSNLFNKTP